eukprot:4453566-Karenia_brevis.AAC.1
MLTVLHKKGDTKILDNYRPISLLRIFYKLFTRVVYSRIRGTLEAAQCCDQAGFRSGYCCEDHLQTIVLIVEAYAEYNSALWACAIDYKKAFDSIEHNALWKALSAQGVDPRYVRVLMSLYKSQVGRIKGRSLSKEFLIERGTKQGDPLSPALFNSVLEHVLGDLQTSWRRR